MNFWFILIRVWIWILSTWGRNFRANYKSHSSRALTCLACQRSRLVFYLFIVFLKLGLFWGNTAFFVYICQPMFFFVSSQRSPRVRLPDSMFLFEKRTHRDVRAWFSSECLGRCCGRYTRFWEIRATRSSWNRRLGDLLGLLSGWFDPP